ncbi:Cell division protein FtsK [Burkholderiales bacterium 8X]|nr:Cell division protein FtsK [Burkholderiales bacterium 8X]
MWVHGDAARRTTAMRALAAIRSRWLRLSGLAAGLDRHAEAISALIECGQLAQAVADASFHRAGERDGPSIATELCMQLTRDMARCCGRSWQSGFEDLGELPHESLAACEHWAQGESEQLTQKEPEGYAFYALYPECHWQAARELAMQTPGCRWQVIGLRSIGTSLAAMVADGLGAATPLTLRPVGHPFEREVACDSTCIDLSADRYAVVDEGPGLSGSSMAAAANWLRAAGVDEAAIDFFPGHAHGPGAQASASTRALWSRVRLQVRSFDEVFLLPSGDGASKPIRQPEAWLAPVLGPLTEPLRDITGGAWRGLQAPSSAEMPPVHPWQERRKFLANTTDGRWLLKFAGLAGIGERKLSRARALAAAGFVPEPMALCHGFLLERWRDDLVPVHGRLDDALRERLADRAAAYIAFRTRNFAAEPEAGASLQALHAMGLHNSRELLGPRAADAWTRWLPRLDAMSRKVHRIEIDGRMHAWEWLFDATRILKADALDHHATHDLVGCQDPGWDVAGAAIELGFSEAQEARLVVELARSSGYLVDAELLQFLKACYLAFQLGAYDMAHSAAGSGEHMPCGAADADRLREQVERYARLLEICLETTAG